MSMPSRSLGDFSQMSIDNKCLEMFSELSLSPRRDALLMILEGNNVSEIWEFLEAEYPRLTASELIMGLYTALSQPGVADNKQIITNCILKLTQRLSTIDAQEETTCNKLIFFLKQKNLEEFLSSDSSNPNEDERDENFAFSMCSELKEIFSLTSLDLWPSIVEHSIDQWIHNAAINPKICISALLLCCHLTSHATDACSDLQESSTLPSVQALVHQALSKCDNIEKRNFFLYEFARVVANEDDSLEILSSQQTLRDLHLTLIDMPSFEITFIQKLFSKLSCLENIKGPAKTKLNEIFDLIVSKPWDFSFSSDKALLVSSMDQFLNKFFLKVGQCVYSAEKCMQIRDDKIIDCIEAILISLEAFTQTTGAQVRHARGARTSAIVAVALNLKALSIGMIFFLYRSLIQFNVKTECFGRLQQVLPIIKMTPNKNEPMPEIVEINTIPVLYYKQNDQVVHRIAKPDSKQKSQTPREDEVSQ